jgi:hypothetical protein
MHPLKQLGIHIMSLAVIISVWLIYATKGQSMTPERITLYMILASMVSVGFRLILPETSRPIPPKK